MNGELKGKIRAWTKKTKRQAELVGQARCWIRKEFGKTRSQVRISLEELEEIKARRRIGRTLAEEIYLQLLEEKKAQEVS